MKRMLKILSVITVSVMLLCGCAEDDDTGGQVSETSSVTVESSAENLHKQEEISDTQKSGSESSKESSVQSSEESPPEISEEDSSQSGEVPEDESSEAESSDISEAEPSEEISAEISDEPERIVDKSIVYGFEKKYFVKRLDEKMLDTFLYMYDAVQHFDMTARFKEPIQSNDLDTLMFLLNYECPEFIQLNGDYSPIYTDESEENVSGVYFTYNMSEQEYEKHSDELKQFFEKLKADIGEADEFEKEKYVYNTIFSECIYDDSDDYSGTVWGTLINHIGRCEGICKSFMWCMRELDVECMCVSGVPKWETDAVYTGHSWNIVKIDGEYYQLDLTVDNLKYLFSDVNYPNYGFFNVNDDFNNQTHEIYDFYNELGVPECESENMNYHKLNDLFVYADCDIEQQTKKILENNFSEGIINNISIKFETLPAMNKACTHFAEWLKEFFEEKEISSYDHRFDCDQICHTITVYAEVSSENGDE